MDFHKLKFIIVIVHLVFQVEHIFQPVQLRIKYLNAFLCSARIFNATIPACVVHTTFYLYNFNSPTQNAFSSGAQSIKEEVIVSPEQ